MASGYLKGGVREPVIQKSFSFYGHARKAEQAGIAAFGATPPQARRAALVRIDSIIGWSHSAEICSVRVWPERSEDEPLASQAASISRKIAGLC